MNHLRVFSTRLFVKALAVAIALELAGASAQTQTLPTALNIVAVEGEGDTGPVRERPSHVPVIRVSDEKGRPVSGAAVVFTLPTEGATGVFPGGAKTLMIMTNEEGRAAAQGFRFNQIPGKVQVNVNVSYKGLTARTFITQVSTAPEGYKAKKGGHTGLLIAILAIAAAGGAGGAYFAMHGATASSTAVTGPQPIGLTPGTGTLAPPH